MENNPILDWFAAIVMLLVAFMQLRNGAFSALILLGNVLLAGLLAFNFWEPLARWLGDRADPLDGYADALCLVGLFVVFLVVLKVVTLRVAPREISLPPLLRHAGGATFGLVTGYLLAGILICVLQTLPWHQRFLGYDPDHGMGLGGPDRVWLAIVHRASGKIFDYRTPKWFDADGSFISRYARYRRYADPVQGPERNLGEFPAVLDTKKSKISLE